MEEFEHTAKVLIVGAGVAGLAAAAHLQQMGQDVLVIEKGRGVGGRLATRRIGQATFDHGAQFITARTPRFVATLEKWAAADVVEKWYQNPAGDHPRWRGKPAMTALAKYLARDVRVLLEKRVVELRHHRAGWAVRLNSRETVLAQAVVLTAPVPQSLALLDAGGVHLSPILRTHLESLVYERCLAVMAVLDGPTQIGPPGGLVPSDGPIAWMADNQLKGISATPAVTIQATAAFSLDHWDADRQESGQVLLRAAAPWLGSAVVEFQVHGWRYSKPIAVEPSLCLTLNRQPPLLIAGDAFAGSRVEGAMLSGWGVVDTLIQLGLNPL
jgi:hypothetical protein